MSKKNCLFFIILFLCINFCFAAQKKISINSYFQSANTAYFRGDYAKSLSIYQDLEAQGLVSKELFFNLSNTYYKLNKIGFAVLYSEKAYKFSPRDSDILYNRKLLLLKTNQKSEFIENITNFFSLNELFYGFTFFYAILFLSCSLLLFWRRKLLISMRTYSLILLILTSVWIFFVYESGYKFKIGVCISSEIPVYSSPNQSSQALFLLPEGKKVVIEDENNDWVNIFIEDKKLKGWTKKENLGILY